MIIDCHSHIWPARHQLAQAADFSCLGAVDVDTALPEEHLAAAEPAAVTFILGFVSRLLQAEIPNSYIAEYLADQNHRLVAFAGIDPTDADADDQLCRLRQEHGFAGLTLSCACQGFHPCDTRLTRIYELAQNLNMPIYFLQGMTLPQNAPLEYAQPQYLDEVARNFPSLKIVISHLGHPWVEQTIALLAKHPNVFTDVAGLADRPWLAYRSLTMAYECGVIEKVLFASDFPSQTVKAAAEALYNLNKITLDSLFPAVPREHLRGIVERDSLTLLGLPRPAAAKAPAYVPVDTGNKI